MLLLQASPYRPEPYRMALFQKHAFFVNNCAIHSGVVESYRTNKAITEAEEDEDDDIEEKW